MLEQIIIFLNTYLEASGIYEKVFTLAELKEKDGKTAPYVFCNDKWESVSNFDTYNGFCYWRSTGPNPTEELDDLVACEDFKRYTYPLVLVSAVPYDKIEKRDAFADDALAITIDQTLSQCTIPLEKTLKARYVNISTGDREYRNPEVLSGEYSGFDVNDIPSKFSYFSIEFDVTVDATANCVNNICNTPSLDLLCPIIKSSTDQEVVNCITEQGRTDAICNLLSCPGGTFDPSAQAFFTEYAITDPIEQNAINQAVKTAKGEQNGINPTGIDLWTSDILYWFPISTKDLTAAMGDLRTPTNSMTAFNTPNHSNLGIWGNGSTMYVDTNISPSTDLTEDDTNFGVYVTENTNSGTDMGCRDNSSSLVRITARQSNFYTMRSYNAVEDFVISNSDAKSYWSINRNGSNLKLYRDGTEIGDQTVTINDSLPATTLKLLCYDNMGSLVSFSTRKITTFIVTKALDATKQKLLYDIIQRLNTDITPGGRQL